MNSDKASTKAGIFLYPGQALLKVWQFAGPACCCKASTLAHGVGPPLFMSNSEMPWNQCMLPWREWWPALIHSNLMAQLWASPNEQLLSLDRAWVAIHESPSVVNTPTSDGRPIVVALRFGRRAIAELLRRSGALLSRRVTDEVLYESAKTGNEESVNLILFDTRGERRAEPWAFPNAMPVRHGGTPLDVATAHGQKSCAQLIRRAGGRHSLHRAAAFGLPGDVGYWLEEGSSPDERDGSGATPLCSVVRSITAGSIDTSSDQCSTSDAVQCIHLLLEARATVDALPITQETPLLTAAARGHVGLCVLLLQAKADPSIRDRNGCNAWDKAANNDVLGVLANAPSNATSSPHPAAQPGQFACTYADPGMFVAGSSARIPHPLSTGKPVFTGAYVSLATGVASNSLAESHTRSRQSGRSSSRMMAANPQARNPRNDQAQFSPPVCPYLLINDPVIEATLQGNMEHGSLQQVPAGYWQSVVGPMWF